MAERSVFVKEGFAFFGFAFTGFWLLAQKLWLEAIAYSARSSRHPAAVAARPAARRLCGRELSAVAADRLEGNEWIRRRLARAGWTQAGTVGGPSLDECERRFFKEWIASAGAPRAAPPPSSRRNSLPQPGAAPWRPRRLPGASRAVGPPVRIALIDYGAGNLHSAGKALERALAETGLDGSVAIVSDARAVAEADRIVLPGDGAFADCMGQLGAAPDMIETLERRVRREGAPFLGICVGMQLLATRGTEHGVTQGLGWIPGSVDRIAPTDRALKVPHMGWNTLDDHGRTP